MRTTSILECDMLSHLENMHLPARFSSAIPDLLSVNFCVYLFKDYLTSVDMANRHLEGTLFKTWKTLC